ncbi:methylenetetrahydrofolate reductase [Roseibium sp. MMSF_3544]|uniref:methylenetetrahydrofolate reductase n=1 Tax=unclassified Roseibium TaxID=2629323 RepID=UPI00273F56E8|nr:methylenetetrahydrofolate reductase [Roseibium sp. MMSF_3544]
MFNIARWITGNGQQERGIEASRSFEDVLSGFSIEVMPRTAPKILDFQTILPQRTRIYVAHIAGTPIEDMVSTVARLTSEGFAVMPHIPARLVDNKNTLENWLRRYRDAGAKQALLVAGGISRPVGDYDSSLALLDSGLFDRYGFERLHIAGHPEGNRDIDPDGSSNNAMKALIDKQNFSDRTGCEMAIVTQFAFEIEPIVAWERQLRDAGVMLPVHLGIAGPAKLQTMIKFAVACGVGPSIRVLQRRAKDVANLLLPYEPIEILRGLQAHLRAHQDSQLSQVHIFPLGGLQRSVDFVQRYTEPTDAVGSQPGLS